MDAILLLEPQIVNTAAMQVCTWLNRQGTPWELYKPLNHQEYAHIWVFSIFDFTPKPGWVFTDQRAVWGGTGFNLDKNLPPEIASQPYDYDLFPECDYSIVWFSRGCCYQDGRHPYCVVPRKEGRIRPVQPMPLNPRGRRILVMDNNITALPDREFYKAMDQLCSWGQPVEFHQGIDIRLMTPQKWQAILRLDVHRRASIHIAWDNPREDLAPIIEKNLASCRAYMLHCFVLIGYWSTAYQDLDRVQKIWALGIDPFVMPYKTRKPEETDGQYEARLEYMKDFARWVNHKAIFKTVAWQDYKKSIKRDRQEQLTA